MTDQDKKPDYKEIYKIVKDLFEKVDFLSYGPFDETYYTLRVFNVAEKIMNQLDEKCDKEAILVAALLHDVGKIKLNFDLLFKGGEFLGSFSEEWRKHSKISVEFAGEILANLNYPSDFLTRVLYLIENHDLRGDKMKERTIELKVLQDADLIADLGMTGFIRPFLYGGKYKRSVIKSIAFIKTEDRTAGGTKLNLELSKKIAKKEMDTQKRLVDEISEGLKNSYFEL
ncbi:MAG: HD domain-containing protein [Nanoarchaeota archaeon]|nr:HD domain-containing protein [Nanoarchaeota archaeon]MBU1501233.1 HD domain-containing protein [Nanoarchaeota archaeon]